MASFDNTTDLERSILNILLSSLMLCRMHAHRLKMELFSNPQRKFIFEALLEKMENDKALLTEMLFKYAVDSKIDDKDRSYYVGEWNLIVALDVQESPDALIHALEEARMGRQALQVSETVVGMLQEGKITDAVSHLKAASITISSGHEDRPIVELTDIARRKATVLDKRAHPEKYLGIKTGFLHIDNYTGGLFPGELTLLAGLTGVGKSTLVKQLECGIVMHPQNGLKNVLHIANEEYQEQVEHKFDANIMGVPYLDFKLATISDEDMKRWEEQMGNWQYGRIFIKEVPAFTDVTLVERAYRELENRGIPIHVIIIDHLPHVKPIQQAWGENDERFKAAADCKELARMLRLPVVVPTQAATVVERKQQRGRRAGKLDVHGSKGQVHVANTFIIITETGKDKDMPVTYEWERDTFWLVDCKKNRDGPPFWFAARHIVKVGRVEVILNKDVADDVKKTVDEQEADEQAKEEAAKSEDSKAEASAREEVARADDTVQKVIGEATGEQASAAEATTRANSDVQEAIKESTRGTILGAIRKKLKFPIKTDG